MIVVDRIEADIAVLEIGGQTFHLPVSALPPGAGEGSVLVLSLDQASTASRRQQAEQRLERLRQRTPSKKMLDL